MSLSVPVDDSISHVAFVLVDALIDILVQKNLISAADVAGLFSTAQIRLSQVSNDSAKRGATFIANRVKFEP